MGIEDAEKLLRRIHPAHVGADGRVMSLAFLDPNLSVDRERIRGLAAVTAAFPGHSFARLIAGECRAQGFAVDADPLAENAAHALIRCEAASRADARRRAKLLRHLAEWPALAL